MTTDPRILEYARLLETSLRLADRLDASANDVETDGRPIETGLIEELERFRLDLEELADGFSYAHSDRSTEPSLSGLRSQVRKLREQLPEVRLLDRFLSLTAPSGLEDLNAQQLLAAKLKESILEGGDADELSRRTLADGTHPWCALCRLVDDQESLSDDEWQRLVGKVRAELGPALATAAQRGRLHCGSRLPATSLIPEPGNTPDADSRNRLIPIVPADPDTTTRDLTETGSHPVEPVRLAEDVPADQPADLCAEAIFRPEGMTRPHQENKDIVPDSCIDVGNGNKSNEAVSEGWLLSTAGFEPAIPELQESASRVLVGADRINEESLKSLIEELVRCRRPALAAHLAGCLDAMPSNGQSWLPGPLVRAWTLCHWVHYPNGSLAAALAKEFTALKAVSVARFSKEERLAFELMVRAAAIRPALVAPETGAAACLRGFPVIQELSRLYNYCVRVGGFAERFGGVSPSVWNSVVSPERYADDLRHLQGEVQEWQSRLRNETCSYAATIPLFQRTHWSLQTGAAHRHPELLTHWKIREETQRRIDRLIDPILNHSPEQAVEVRSQAKRLMQFVSTELDAPDDETRETLKTAVRQAVTFVQRWLSNLALGSGSRQLPSPELEELAGEIRTRHAEVLTELDILVRRSQSAIVATAAKCLKESLNDVLNLFRTREIHDLDEPDPRHLLNADLLKVIGVPLNRQWEPELPPTDLVRRLVQSLTEPSPNWEMAICLHEDRRDRESIERILSLDLWTPEERRNWQSWIAGRTRRELEARWATDEGPRTLAMESAPRIVELAVPRDRVERLRRIFAVDNSLSRPTTDDGNVFPAGDESPAGTISRRLRERLLKITRSDSESSVFEGE